MYQKQLMVIQEGTESLGMARSRRQTAHLPTAMHCNETARQRRNSQKAIMAAAGHNPTLFDQAGWQPGSSERALVASYLMGVRIT
jgi:hypothetical protein